MSTQTLTYEETRSGVRVRVADFVELTKPRIAVLVLVTVAVAAFVAGWGPPDPLLLFNTLLGTTLVASSASALNQWLERESDALMARTADRPLPAGRLGSLEVLVFSAATIVAGLVYLAACVNLPTAAWGFLTWLVYVWIYTPLKTRTSANTAVGAVAGALPVLIGWSSVGAPLGLKAFTLFLIVFLWQFPHFMAIAWIYRHQYAKAGLKMLPVVDPSGRRAGMQAVVCALVLVPVSLVPAVLEPAFGVYFGWALVLSLAQLACAVLFCLRLDETSARRLLRASLIYLPAILLALVLSPLVKLRGSEVQVAPGAPLPAADSYFVEKG
jgi:protoheme IX farnesyltransferase